jgi:hypothetical protein
MSEVAIALAVEGMLGLERCGQGRRIESEQALRSLATSRRLTYPIAPPQRHETAKPVLLACFRRSGEKSLTNQYSPRCAAKPRGVRTDLTLNLGNSYSAPDAKKPALPENSALPKSLISAPSELPTSWQFPRRTAAKSSG